MGLLTHGPLFFPPNLIRTVQLITTSPKELASYSSADVDTLSIFIPNILNRNHYSGHLFHYWPHKAKEDLFYCRVWSSFQFTITSATLKHGSDSDCHSGTSG